MSSAPPLTGPAAPKVPLAGRILAVDYGRARMGLAIAESLQGIAQPLNTLKRINRNEDMRRLRELVRDNAVKLVLVGLPLRLDGARGEMAEETLRFAQRMRKQIGVAVEMADERLTSWEAERLLEEEFGRKSRQIDGAPKKRDASKFTVDSVAATIILREYLQRHSPEQHSNAAPEER
ncbi:MAG TPA: Holliday junction resolvase RuvX [Candidatus Acidoferrum sp.]|nr:Holliday junction resolvase RuvX [Candidatus Acidoferrum sp.]